MIKGFPRRLISVLIFFSFLDFLNAQRSLEISKSFDSDWLNGSIRYSIYTPDSEVNDSIYPLLYLLHGFGSDETSWSNKINFRHVMDSLIDNGIIPPCIVVMPDGRKSYYINDYQMKEPYENAFMQEFVPYIESRYPVHGNKQSRAIAGLSMGGFGSTILPAKYPDFFGTSINFSGAVRTPKEFAKISPVRYHGYFSSIFGNSLRGFERITPHWKANSLYYIIDSTNREDYIDINWYIDCGLEDFLFPSNKAMHDYFTSLEIPHEFHFRHGEHTWNYWRKSFIMAMVYWGGILNERMRE